MSKREIVRVCDLRTNDRVSSVEALKSEACIVEWDGSNLSYLLDGTDKVVVLPLTDYMDQIARYES